MSASSARLPDARGSRLITTIRRAYKTLYMSGLQLAEAREQLAQGSGSEDIAAILRFLERSERPLMR